MVKDYRIRNTIICKDCKCLQLVSRLYVTADFKQPFLIQYENTRPGKTYSRSKRYEFEEYYQITQSLRPRLNELSGNMREYRWRYRVVWQDYPVVMQSRVDLAPLLLQPFCSNSSTSSRPSVNRKAIPAANEPIAQLGHWRTWRAYDKHVRAACGLLYCSKRFCIAYHACAHSCYWLHYVDVSYQRYYQSTTTRSNMRQR